MGVLILSLAVYLFANFRATADEATKLMYEEELAQFNNFYLSYDGKTDLTYYDVWNVVNKAKENNKKYGLTKKEGNNYYVGVYLGPSELKVTNVRIDNVSKLDSNVLNGEDLRKYKCEVSINNVTGRVFKVTFTEINS